MELHREIAAYLESVTGERPVMTPMPKDALAGLPVYLGRAYAIHEIRLFGHTLPIALPKAKLRASLAQLMSDRSALAAKLGKEVILALPEAQSYERRNLVRKQVPFLVPGRQLFLPMLLTDLRETFSGRAQPQPIAMSWVSQTIVLTHLLAGGIVGRPLTDVAAKLGYSSMAITQSVTELAALELCAKVQHGRTKTIQFDFAPGSLWKAALGYMRSPVRKRYYVIESDVRIPDALDTGLSALSRLTDLAYTGRRVAALLNKDIGRMLSDSGLKTCAYEEDAAIVLEGWSYRPERLSAGPMVDELSLYLSLKEAPDERVQIALTRLMERRVW